MAECKNCGQDVEKVNGATGYCQDCMKEYLEEKLREKKTGHNKEPKKRKCHSCGGECNRAEKYGQQIWVCTECQAEFNKIGEYIHLPWYKEPTNNELGTINTPDGRDLFKQIVHYIQDNLVLPQKIHYIVMALWTCSTYRMKDFDTTGYLGFYGAGNEKGKTRALKVLNELCYRATLVAKPTRPFVTKALSDSATVIIDQAENAFYSNKDRTDIYDIWTSGYQRDIPLGQLSSQDHISYNAKGTFGAKAVSMQEDGRTDNPLNMRTHPFYMQKGTPKNKYLDKQTSVRLRLLLHKFFQPNIQLYSLPYDKKSYMRDRVAEICDPLIFTARMMKLPEELVERIYLYAIGLMYEKSDESHDTFPARILWGINEFVGMGQVEIMPGDIASKLKEMYKDEDEAKWYTASKVGAMMKKFGFKKSGRRNNGVFYNILDDQNSVVYDKIQTQYVPRTIEEEVNSLKQEIAKTLEFENKELGSIKDLELDKQLIRLLKFRDYLESKERQAIKDSWVGVDIDGLFDQETLPEPEQNTPDTGSVDDIQGEPEHQCPICSKVVSGKNINQICDDCEKLIPPS